MDLQLGSFVSYYQQWHRNVWHHWHQEVGTRHLWQYKGYRKGKASCKGERGWQKQIAMHFMMWSIAKRWLLSFWKTERYVGITKNIVLDIAKGNIVPDYRIKTSDNLVAEVNFIWKRNSQKAHVPKKTFFTKSENINELHIELGHLLEDITRAMGKAILLQLVKIVPWRKLKRLM